MGVYIYDVGYVWWCVFCIVSVVLQYKFRWCILVVDDYPVQLCVAGCQLRISEQGGEFVRKEYISHFSGD